MKQSMSDRRDNSERPCGRKVLGMLKGQEETSDPSSRVSGRERDGREKWRSHPCRMLLEFRFCPKCHKEATVRF